MGGNINTSQLEAAPSISFDRTTLYFEAYNKVNTTLDIFTSNWHEPSSQWLPRKPLGLSLNSNYDDERHPFICRDGVTMYFDSDRPGGPGYFDIWVAEKLGSNWIAQGPLPPPLNTTAYEAAPYVFYYPGGRQLYFETTRWGDNELVVSEWDPVLKQWESPNRMCKGFSSSLHPSINTYGDEMLYHTAEYPGNEEIWIAHCNPTPTPTGTWFSPVPTVTPELVFPVPVSRPVVLLLGFLMVTVFLLWKVR
jgi:Tol biopolymer transport system component